MSEHGFDVTVYCRRHYYDDRWDEYKGVRCVHLPAPGGKSLESIIHSNLSIFHATARSFDLAFVVDPGNAPFVLPLILRGVPRVMHTDGLGWRRSKWSPLQQRYYKWSEGICARLATWLVTDSRVMRQYYRAEYGADSTFIPYGHATGDECSDEGLRRFALEPGRYLLVVARLEPENNVDLIIREYAQSSSQLPLVVVGGSPYESDYARRVSSMGSHRVRCVGGVWEPAVLNGLYRNCYLYLHGHEVGGTNPSLLRAMGAGVACLPLDVPFHREVMGDENEYFEKEPGSLGACIGRLERDQPRILAMAGLARRRALTLYRWDAVAAAYAELFRAVIGARRAGERFRPSAGFEPYRPLEFSEPRGEASN